MAFKPREIPSADVCWLHLDYNPDTGVFTRKARPVDTYKRPVSAKQMASRDAGKPSGCVTAAGYVSIYICTQTYMAHRIAWHMAVGPIPEGMVVDHINGNKSDNRLCNLRLATPTQNNQNHTPRRSSSGLKGVVWHRDSKRWQARIRVNKKEISLGLYKTKLLAYDAYVAAAIIHFGEFAKF